CVCATSLALISLWHCKQAVSESIFGFNCPVRAHVLASVWPGESRCISWHEIHENSPPRKQGDACTPLNSRPVTRIIPSPQNRFPKKPGSVRRIKSFWSLRSDVFGCTTKRCARSCPPGRKPVPWRLKSILSVMLLKAQTLWH